MSFQYFSHKDEYLHIDFIADIGNNVSENYPQVIFDEGKCQRTIYSFDFCALKNKEGKLFLELLYLGTLLNIKRIIVNAPFNGAFETSSGPTSCSFTCSFNSESNYCVAILPLIIYNVTKNLK